MFYGSTKSLLDSIIRQLKIEAPEDDAAWQAQTDVLQSCLEEMVAMRESPVNPLPGTASRYVHRPVSDKLNRAIPHVWSMLTAMRDRNRTTALECGETALQRL